jgi:tetrahydromethanopterin S-methyltransferase subunit F
MKYVIEETSLHQIWQYQALQSRTQADINDIRFKNQFYYENEKFVVVVAVVGVAGVVVGDRTNMMILKMDSEGKILIY